jgi:hypothetical protein
MKIEACKRVIKLRISIREYKGYTNRSHREPCFVERETLAFEFTTPRRQPNQVQGLMAGWLVASN